MCPMLRTFAQYFKTCRSVGSFKGMSFWPYAATLSTSQTDSNKVEIAYEIDPPN